MTNLVNKDAINKLPNIKFGPTIIHLFNPTFTTANEVTPKHFSGYTNVTRVHFHM